MLHILHILLFALCLYNLDGWIVKTNVPKALWGKKLMVNGPRENSKKLSPFDGIGHITSVVFDKNETVISEVIIPSDKNEMNFPLSDLIQRNYFNLISKLPHMLFKTKTIQSGTRNTAVIKYNNQYYAVEESCNPVKLNYNTQNELQYNGRSRSISRMSVHKPDENTIFSYGYRTIPLKINGTIEVPWFPKKYPFLVHDCKRTEDKQYFIFPLMSTSLGRMVDYFKELIDIPFDENANKVGWLIYDFKNNKCEEIMMDEYADIFHISHVKHMYRNVHKVYASFVYNFPAWITGVGKLDIKLKEVVLDLDKNKIIKTFDTGLKMDFLHTRGDLIIGSCLDSSPAIIKYDTIRKSHKKIFLPGKEVREIIPYDDYLLYFSHEIDRSYLYITSVDTGEIVDKIKIPHRLPGFHTTLFE
jgi:hypothetical protein